MGSFLGLNVTFLHCRHTSATTFTYQNQRPVILIQGLIIDSLTLQVINTFSILFSFLITPHNKEDTMKLTKTIALATMTSSALFLAGCNSTGGYNSMNNTAKGATAGAVAGALIKSGGNSKDIAKGAATGAAIGGVSGYVIDHTN